MQASARLRLPAFYNPFYGQLAVLFSLIAYAGISERFAIIPAVAVTLFVMTSVTQYICCRVAGKAFSPLAAGITACSLTLLLRTNSVYVAAIAAIIAISSKFLVRVGQRHIFNPANLALALVPLLLPAWISPGQWGHDVAIVLLLVCCGTAITGGVRRVEGALIFLSGYVAALFARAFYYGDPMAIPLHQLENAGLILFAFFMLSDPKTTPAGRGGQALFSLAVLALTLVLQWMYFIPAAFIYALCGACALRGVAMVLGARRGV